MFKGYKYLCVHERRCCIVAGRQRRCSWWWRHGTARARRRFHRAQHLHRLSLGAGRRRGTAREGFARRRQSLARPRRSRRSRSGRRLPRSRCRPPREQRVQPHWCICATLRPRLPALGRQLIALLSSPTWRSPCSKWPITTPPAHCRSLNLRISSIRYGRPRVFSKV